MRSLCYSIYSRKVTGLTCDTKNDFCLNRQLIRMWVYLRVLVDISVNGGRERPLGREALRGRSLGGVAGVRRRAGGVHSASINQNSNRQALDPCRLICKTETEPYIGKETATQGGWRGA